jgi:hypothetical protein
MECWDNPISITPVLQHSNSSLKRPQLDRATPFARGMFGA